MTPTSAPARATPVRAVSVYPRAAWYFSAALLLVVAGFYPSYFAQLHKADALHHFHGIAATAWMLLLIVQAFLATAPRRWPLHRTLGWSSLIIAPLFVVSGALVVRLMLTGYDGFSRMFGRRLAFIDVTTLGYFAAVYVLALVHRRNQSVHARYLATTAILALPPGVTRLLHNLAQGRLGFEASLHLTFLFCLLVTGALLWDDYKKGGMRAPYLSLAALLVIQQIGFAVIR